MTLDLASLAGLHQDSLGRTCSIPRDLSCDWSKMCARLLMVQLIGREQGVSAHRRRPGDFLVKMSTRYFAGYMRRRRLFVN